ncbi:MAG: hypothetical protein PVG71_15670 [Anaerolineae bacterium]|jgi:hypothetical protein
MGLRERLANALFGDLLGGIVDQRIQEAGKHSAAGPVSVRVDDSRGWDQLAGGGPADRPWADKYADLEDILEAWRRNFFVRRLVTLTRSYAIAGGITVSSDVPEVQTFIDAFWNHRQNRLDRRLGPLCDELTRAGEIFPILFTNRGDGMSYVRFVPAFRIRTIETDDDDYEIETRYGQTREDTAEAKWWIGPGHRHAFRTYYNKLKPLMLHFTVNQPIGATRGESDLTPVLPWARRYSEWLKDRVRLNRIRTRQAVLHLKLSDPSQVEQKRQQIRTDNPIETGIYVSGPDEELIAHDLAIKAGEAKEDGRALRLAIATGGNVGLHYLGEGETVNYATAREMGEPTARFYSERQTDIIEALKALVAAAYRRRCAMIGKAWPGLHQLQLSASATEVARADNQSLAQAARDIVLALAQMREAGWIDDETAIQMAFKFAGEPIGKEDIQAILQQNQGEPAQ